MHEYKVSLNGINEYNFLQSNHIFSYSFLTFLVGGITLLTVDFFDTLSV